MGGCEPVPNQQSQDYFSYKILVNQHIFIDFQAINCNQKSSGGKIDMIPGHIRLRVMCSK